MFFFPFFACFLFLRPKSFYSLLLCRLYHVALWVWVWVVFCRHKHETGCIMEHKHKRWMCPRPFRWLNWESVWPSVLKLGWQQCFASSGHTLFLSCGQTAMHRGVTGAPGVCPALQVWCQSMSSRHASACVLHCVTRCWVRALVSALQHDSVIHSTDHFLCSRPLFIFLAFSNFCSFNSV